MTGELKKKVSICRGGIEIWEVFDTLSCAWWGRGKGGEVYIRRRSMLCALDSKL